ncbi:MAG: hypothetical protein AB4038_22290, partial [Prochloraceae cyanobacterium]
QYSRKTNPPNNELRETMEDVREIDNLTEQIQPSSMPIQFNEPTSSSTINDEDDASDWFPPIRP